jgi:hypothetical protein
MTIGKERIPILLAAQRHPQPLGQSHYVEVVAP